MEMPLSPSDTAATKACADRPLIEAARSLLCGLRYATPIWRSAPLASEVYADTIAIRVATP
eukprot:11174657-Lingulodinium_polyedra.AAC.1